MLTRFPICSVILTLAIPVVVVVGKRPPNIDSIAKTGVRFTAGTCSPSRAALITGRYLQRFGFEFNTTGTLERAEVSATERNWHVSVVLEVGQTSAA